MIFKDINHNLKNELNIFQENIQDSFGNSIIKEVYHPMISDINTLETTEENIEIKLMEIESNLQEIRLIV